MSNGDAPLEFFIEGTRRFRSRVGFLFAAPCSQTRASRTGKSLHPKLGLLAMSLKPFFECHVPDITVIPIGITYEERMESHLYVRAL